MITDSPVNNHKDLAKVVDGLLEEVGLDRKDLGGKLTFAGMDPIRPTRLKVGSASATITGANAIASGTKASATVTPDCKSLFVDPDCGRKKFSIVSPYR